MRCPVCHAEDHETVTIGKVTFIYCPDVPYGYDFAINVHALEEAIKNVD